MTNCKYLCTNCLQVTRHHTKVCVICHNPELYRLSKNARAPSSIASNSKWKKFIELFVHPEEIKEKIIKNINNRKIKLDLPKIPRSQEETEDEKEPEKLSILNNNDFIVVKGTILNSCNKYVCLDSLHVKKQKVNKYKEFMLINNKRKQPYFFRYTVDGNLAKYYAFFITKKDAERVYSFMFKATNSNGVRFIFD